MHQDKLHNKVKNLQRNINVHRPRFNTQKGKKWKSNPNVEQNPEEVHHEFEMLHHEKHQVHEG